MEHITSSELWTPSAPITAAIKTPQAIYCSGQLPVDKNGNYCQGTIQEKTRQVCKNLQTVLKAAGSDISKVVKVNIFLDDMANFGAMNEEYAKWFTHKPARSCVAVKTLPGPPNCNVEIECTALPGTNTSRL